MKRAALFLLLAGAPLVLVLFPQLRRALVRKARMLLLIWAGAVLFVGVLAGSRAAFLESESVPTVALSAIGLLLFTVSFLLVARDSRSSSKNEGPKGPR